MKMMHTAATSIACHQAKYLTIRGRNVIHVIICFDDDYDDDE
jgi:hypothetical protein